MTYIEQLLNGENVEWKKLGEVCEIKTGKGVTKKNAISNGVYPIISGGKKPMDYINIHNREANTVTVSRVGANAGYVNYISERFYLNDKCFSVISKKDNVFIPRFLYYALKKQEDNISSLQSQGGVPTINTVKLGNILIPLPPLSVQHKIVEILDKFTALEAELEANLEAELDCRKRQYEYYRNQLLSFDMLNMGGGQKLNDVKIMTLGEIGTFVRGSGLQKKDFTPTGVGCIHYGQIYTYYGTYAKKTKSFVSQEFALKARKAKHGDLIIATTSENDEDVCKAVAWLGDEDIAVSSDACFYAHTMNPKYIAYHFQTELFQSQKRKFITGTKVRRVNAKDLAKIKIPLPPLSVQREIVEILDKFDTLCNSISEGLPKEIELRRKQYEYYRNQLLTFAQ